MSSQPVTSCPPPANRFVNPYYVFRATDYQCARRTINMPSEFLEHVPLPLTNPVGSLFFCVPVAVGIVIGYLSALALGRGACLSGASSE
jgi:hypothetical protein